MSKALKFILGCVIVVITAILVTACDSSPVQSQPNSVFVCVRYDTSGGCVEGYNLPYGRA